MNYLSGWRLIVFNFPLLRFRSTLTARWLKRLRKRPRGRWSRKWPRAPPLGASKISFFPTVLPTSGVQRFSLELPGHPLQYFGTCHMLLCITLELTPPSPSFPPYRSYAKGFGAMGALFAGSECVIEKMRARHDMYNSIYAGCTTGALLAHSGGPKAMCIGCASFAAFSALIDRFMGH